MSRHHAALVSFGLLVLFLLPVDHAVAGDQDAALKDYRSGEDAYRARRYEEAAQDFRRALTEYRPLPEAAVELGRALEALDRPRKALKAYLDGEDQIDGIAAPTEEQRRMRERASGAVRRLDHDYGRLAGIDERFERKFLASGRRHRRSEPAIARESFAAAAALNPGNTEAKDQVKSLAAAAEKSVEDRYSPLVESDAMSGWEPGATAAWSSANGVVRVDSSGVSGDTNRLEKPLSGSFSIRYRLRVDAVKGQKSVAGLVLADRDGSAGYFVLLALGPRDDVRLTRFSNQSGWRPLKEAPLNLLDHSTWHTYEVDVTPGVFTLKLDGRRLLRVEDLPADAFDGPLGLFAQQVEADFRDLAVDREYMGPAALAFRKLVESYTSEVMEVAEKAGKEKPDLARRCLRRVLAVDPENTAAPELAHRLGVSLSTDSEKRIFDGEDLIGWFLAGEQAAVRDGHLVVTGGASAYYDYYQTPLSGDYSIVWEMKVNADTGKMPVVVFTFAVEGQSAYYGFAMYSYVYVLRHSLDHTDAKQVKMLYFNKMASPPDRTAWNRYEVRVKGKDVTFLVNGKSTMSFEAAGDGVFDGMPGFLVQGCTAEFRKIAVVQH